MSKVLVIEDNEQNLYLITFILKQNGFEVIQARDGKEGITRANDGGIAAILLDIQLPLILPKGARAVWSLPDTKR